VAGMFINRGQNDKNMNNIQVLYDEMMAKEIISNRILSALPLGENRDIIIVCIGTDRSTGDALGPLTGTFLQEKLLRYFNVYGTLDQPIHALNLAEKIDEIYSQHHNPFLIAIDACLGKTESIGKIQIGEGPVKPGAGVHKELPAVGDMHITGIVNMSGFMEFTVLQNTRLNLVLRMAKTIASGINRAHLRLHYEHSILSMNQQHSRENTI